LGRNNQGHKTKTELQQQQNNNGAKLRDDGKTAYQETLKPRAYDVFRNRKIQKIRRFFSTLNW
jgi:hypothetical protein